MTCCTKNDQHATLETDLQRLLQTQMCFRVCPCILKTLKLGQHRAHTVLLSMLEKGAVPSEEDIMLENSKRPGGLAASLNRTKTKAGSLSGLKIVRGSPKSVDYAFPKPRLIPKGQYHSKIVDVFESTTKQGDDAVDVHYDFTNENQRYRVKMRYPVASSHFQALCDALIDAGVPENASIKKAIGVEETVELDYPNGATMGSIVSRSPVMSTAVEAVEDDDYDMLDDDDLDVN